jgi:hypothetical protein
VIPDPLTFYYQRRVATPVAKDRLPVMYGLLEYVDAGGLIAYGPNQALLLGRAAEYVDKILRGAKSCRPAHRGANAVCPRGQSQDGQRAGHCDPESILLRADEVIR